MLKTEGLWFALVISQVLIIIYWSALGMREPSRNQGFFRHLKKIAGLPESFSNFKTLSD